MAEDPFPRDRVGATLRRVPAYLRLAWNLAREPLLSRARRAAVIGAAGYLASPVDLVPGVIPVLGQLDDIAVALAALRFALAGLSPEQRRRHLETVGLGDDLLAEDIRNLAVTTAWLVRAGARTTNRLARRTGTVTMAGAKVGARATRTVAGAAASTAGPVARGAAARSRPALDRAAMLSAAAARTAARRLPRGTRSRQDDNLLPVELEGVSEDGEEQGGG